MHLAHPRRRWLVGSAITALALGAACGGGGGGNGGTAQPSELGDWSVGTVSMSGGETFEYQSARLRFTQSPSQVQFSAQHGDTVYSWTSGYTKNADAITTTNVPEASDPTDLVSLDLVLESDTSLTGVVHETYPSGGGQVTVEGTIDATR